MSVRRATHAGSWYTSSAAPSTWRPVWSAIRARQALRWGKVRTAPGASFSVYLLRTYLKGGGTSFVEVAGLGEKVWAKVKQGVRASVEKTGAQKVQDLNDQLEGWLAAAKPTLSPARAIIAPHAGYAYCGACGAHAYRQVDPRNIKRVFILGPSHHVRLSGCAVTGTHTYNTPLYDLVIDTGITQELLQTGQFEVMDITTDEDEHSIEMHLPYVAKVMESKKDQFTVVPVLVGGLSVDQEAKYGRLFSKYLADPQNLFVISSDFCHWGQRFKYAHYDRSQGDIYQSIEALDRMAVKYLKTANSHTLSLRFLNYAQSSRCRRKEDSSVSYAAAALVVH
ncbi:protein MEMO1-like isoform X2 [Branchiostoma lanceolatum]|uniref:protein MEMO1-like isoform X2 n=1 Tax=Branchiostoma lanceolatum TaxID=7740 RepID=UPI003451A4D9